MTKDEKKALASIKLDVTDRFAIAKLMPAEGNILKLTLARDIKLKTDFTQIEFDKYEMKFGDKGSVNWNKDKDKGTVVKLTNAEIEFLKAQVDVMDKQSKLTLDLLPLCLKIRESKLKE